MALFLIFFLLGGKNWTTYCIQMGKEDGPTPKARAAATATGEGADTGAEVTSTLPGQGNRQRRSQRERRLRHDLSNSCTFLDLHRLRETSLMAVMQDVLHGVNDTDPVLFEAVGKGDARALGELVVRHDRWVRGVVYSVVKHVDQVDDITQEIWLSVWQRAGLIDDRTKWQSWLSRLARNVAIDTVRRRKNWLRCVERFKAAACAGRRRSPTPLAYLAAREKHQDILEKIEELPEIYRQVFILRHLEDWSYGRIAEVLSLPVATVETRLVRARKLLRQRIGTQ